MRSKLSPIWLCLILIQVPLPEEKARPLPQKLDIGGIIYGRLVYYYVMVLHGNVQQKQSLITCSTQLIFLVVQRTKFPTSSGHQERRDHKEGEKSEKGDKFKFKFLPCYFMPSFKC